MFSCSLKVLFFLLLSAELCRGAVQSGVNENNEAFFIARDLNISILEQVRIHNENTRKLVPHWVTKSDWNSPPSLFNYGLPKHILRFIDESCGGVLVQHDLISYLGHLLEKAQPMGVPRIAYLEIGVSVGKGLFTQVNFFRKGTPIVAFDVEDVNPTLANWFDEKKVHESWTEERLYNNGNTIRRSEKAAASGHSKDSIILLSKSSPAEMPTLTYLASDVFNYVSWEKLRTYKQEHTPSSSFNLIFSDAAHSKEAVLFEWEMMAKNRIVDYRNFAIVWDDCWPNSGNVRGAFEQVRKEMPSDSGGKAQLLCSIVVRIHSWVGVHEHMHDTCILTTLDLRKISEFQHLKVMQQIECAETGK